MPTALILPVRGDLLRYGDGDRAGLRGLGMLLPAWTVPDLLAWWFGPPARVGRRPSSELPPPLLDLYLALDEYDEELLVHNQLLAPEDVARVDGLLVFWLENERTSEWATDGVDVFERPTGMGADWTPTETALADFLVSVVAFEAVLGAAHSVDADDIDEVTRARLLAGLTRAPMPGPLVDTELLSGCGVLAFTGEGFAIVASRRPSLLEPYRRRLG